MKRVINSDYELPDYEDPEVLEFEEKIEFHLDADITIDDSGNWTYEDKEYPWAKRDGEFDYWDAYPYDYPGLTVQVADTDEVVEYTDELLETLLPFTSGKFHIEGDVTLAFNISEVQMYGHPSEYSDDLEYYTDGAEIEFLFDKSSIDNFEIEEI